jgi:hypothetical protein
MKSDCFTVGHLREILAPLSTIRRQAILFGIEGRFTAQTVMMLRWKIALQLPLPILCSDILKTLPRHMKMETVFWEELASGLVTPLFQLEESLELASQLTWKQLSERYHRMVWVDQEAELRSFYRDFADAT